MLPYLLTIGACENGYHGLCSWADEEDLAGHLTGNLGGEWRQVDSASPDAFRRLFISHDNRPRYFQWVRQDDLQADNGLHASDSVSFGCGDYDQRALVLGDPNRFVERNVGIGNMLVDVSPLDDGPGYVLTHHSSHRPDALETHYESVVLTHLIQVDENTIRFTRALPEVAIETTIDTYTRFSEEFPEELATMLGLPDDKNP